MAFVDLRDNQTVNFLGIRPGEDIYVGYEYESLLMGDDTIYGPNNGQSMMGRMLDGNDTLQVQGGLSNDMNLNRGNDSAFLYAGGGKIRGGSENDYLAIVGGQWDVVNGNRGEDYLINYSKFGGTIRGGSENDTLVNAGGGGYFYGDSGADTFKPYAVDANGNITNVMFIEDFQPGIDILDLGSIGGANIVYSNGNTLIGSTLTGELVASLEGVIY